MALLLVGTQITAMLTFFLSRNIRLARQPAWDQTVASRGKGPEFWQPYVEEWDVPPVVKADFISRVMNKLGLFFVIVLVKRGGYPDFVYVGPTWPCPRLLKVVGSGVCFLVIIIPLSLYPFVGTIAVAALKAMDTAQYLHQPVCACSMAYCSFLPPTALQYFKAKKMTPLQIAIFTEERKWDYRCAGYFLLRLTMQSSLPLIVFGFAAALLEGLPIVGLVFTISNRIGAAMWAHGKTECLILVSNFILGPKGSDFLFFLYMHINRLSQI